MARKPKYPYNLPEKLPPNLPPGLYPEFLELSMESMVQDISEEILLMVRYLHDPDPKKMLQNFRAFFEIGKDAPRETNVYRILGIEEPPTA